MWEFSKSKSVLISWKLFIFSLVYNRRCAFAYYLNLALKIPGLTLEFQAIQNKNLRRIHTWDIFWNKRVWFEHSSNPGVVCLRTQPTQQLQQTALIFSGNRWWKMVCQYGKYGLVPLCIAVWKSVQRSSHSFTASFINVTVFVCGVQHRWGISLPRWNKLIPAHSVVVAVVMMMSHNSKCYQYTRGSDVRKALLSPVHKGNMQVDLEQIIRFGTN